MKKTIVIAAVMFFALSLSAFAQSSFTVASERPTVACCGLAEAVGAISFTSVPSNPADVTASGTVQITYTQPIANVGTDLGALGVQLTTTGGVAATLTSVTNIAGQGVVVFTIPAGQPAGYRVRVSNARINVSTSCNQPTAVTAAAQSVGNDLTVSETEQIPVLSAIMPALLAPTVATPAVVDASNGQVNGAAAPGTVTIVVQEGFFNAFGLTPASDPTQTVGKIVRLKITGTLPSGVSLVFPATDSSGLFSRANSAGAVQAGTQTVTTVPTNVYYVLTADSLAGVQESLSVDVQVNTVGPFPLAPGSLSVSAHIGPISSSASVYPRYIEGTCETTATPFLTVSGALTTTLMVPYAVDLGTSEQGLYQTGIVVSNTTSDPGTAAMGFLQAIPQTGKLTVYFFAADGTAIDPWVSTDHPGFGGLDDNGELPPGGQFVAMVNQLLGEGDTFSGYLFIITDFTNAHGEFFISNFDNFTHGALMLVVNQPNVSTLVGRTIPEGLNQ